MKQSNKFPKSEHLCGDKNLTRLFSQGSAFMAYPLRVVSLIETQDDSNEVARIVVIVSKKRFKKAVDRNRLKRLMREAYRLNKSDLLQELTTKNKQALIAFHYVAENELEFAAVERKMKVALKKIIELI